MPTVAEMELLNRGMENLAGTFQRNRTLTEAERRAKADEALQREMLGQRRQEHSDTLGLHRETAASTAEHQKVLEQIQRESKALQERHYKLMAGTGLLTQLQKGLAEGTIKPEALKAAVGENPLLKELGLGVDIFQAPPADVGAPEVWDDKASGRRFAYRKGSKEMHDLTPNAATVREEPGEFGGPPKRTITRRLGPADLQAAMAELGGGEGEGEEAPDMEQTLKDLESGQALPAWGPTGAPAAGAKPAATATAQPAPESGERVTVISPTGKVGTVPKAQLQQALAEGYKVHQ